MNTVTQLDREIKRAQDAIKYNLKNDFANISIYQRKSLNVIIRMSYYLGMGEYSKERKSIRNSLLTDDEEGDDE